MAGLLLGALAGAAGGFADGFNDGYKERQAERMDTRRAAIEDQRARALILFKQGVENQARTDMAARVSNAAGTIADGQVAKRRGLIEGGIADRSTWTPEQQAAVDQSLGLDRAAIAEDPDVRTAAAVQTGDIDPKTAAGLDIQGKKAEAAAIAAERKDRLERDRMDQRDRQESARLEQRDRIADRNADLQERRIGAMAARIGGSSKDDKEKAVLAYIEGRRKELADDAANTKALYAAALKDAPSTRRATIEAEFKPRMDAIDEKRRQVEDDFDALRERVGLPAKRSAAQPPAAAPSTAPAASPAQAPAAAPKASTPLGKLPEGARQIGTSGGKPVYQTPDGRRFVAQ